MFQVLISGAINGVIYALLAIGFTLTFGIARIVNLYHGTYYMLGAYFVFVFYSIAGIPLIVSVLLSIFMVMVVAVIIYYPIKKLKKYEESGAILVFTLVASYFTQYLLIQIFGYKYLNIPSFVNGSLLISGVRVGNSRLLASIVGLLLIGGVWLFMKHTRTGKEIVITAQDSYIAQLLGINTDRILVITLAVSAMLAAVAGIMVSPFLSIYPDMWLNPLIMAFSVVIVGGLGSIAGSVAAAFIIGYIQSGMTFFVSSDAAEIAILAVVMLIIIFRPSGLLGKRND